VGVFRRRAPTKAIEELASLGIFGLPFRTLLSREIRRFMKEAKREGHIE
jgi:hypothetical protein